jgi:transcriptional regulator with XRE-family HTH domain
MTLVGNQYGERDRQLSTAEWEALLGRQFRSLRLRAELDQVTLAGRAAVSLGALKNLESGGGSSLKTVVRVAIALDCAHWLRTLSPPISVSPIEILRSGREPRRRVYRARRKKL